MLDFFVIGVARRAVGRYPQERLECIGNTECFDDVYPKASLRHLVPSVSKRRSQVGGECVQRLRGPNLTYQIREALFLPALLFVQGGINQLRFRILATELPENGERLARFGLQIGLGILDDPQAALATEFPDQQLLPL